MQKVDKLAGYEPLPWDAESTLSREQQEAIEAQRRDLYRGGVRDPHLTQIAYEFAALICMRRAAKAAGFT